nr:cytochrome P450 716B1-like [Tanacetum cinerariifolium]
NVLTSTQPPSISRTIGSKNVFELSGHDHERVRAALVSFLKLDVLKQYVAKIDAEIQYHLQTHWHGKNEIQVQPLIKTLTFNIICSHFFGIERGPKREKFLPLFQDMIEASPNKDLITSFLSIRDDDSSTMMSEEEIIDNIIIVMIGGYDTTFILISFLVKLLVDDKATYSKVVQEIGKTKARGEALTWEDLTMMKYTWRVASEVLLSSFMTHMDSDIFENPTKFDPSRFEKQAPSPPPFIYIAFGGGLRMCPGIELAKMETLAMIHQLVTQFTWELVKKDESFKRLPMPKFDQGLGPKTEKFLTLFQDMIEGILEIPINLPFTQFNRGIRARKKMVPMHMDLIHEKRDVLEKQKHLASPNKDLITSFLSIRDDDSSTMMSEEEIIDNVIIVMIGGYGTTSILISFLVKLLANDKAIYYKVVQEQEEIGKTKARGEALTWKNLTKMKYTWRVASEVLRITPPVTLSFRRAKQDIEIEITSSQVVSYDGSSNSCTLTLADETAIFFASSKNVDGVGWDWNYMANDEENHALIADKETPIEFALIAKTNAEIKVFNNSLCSKASSKDLDSLLESQRLDKNKEGLGYSAVPPPLAQIYSSPKKDMSWTGLYEFKDDTVTDYNRPSPIIESTSDDVQNRNPSVTETEASPSTISPKPFIKFLKANDSPTKSKTDKVKTAKKSPVKPSPAIESTSDDAQNINPSLTETEASPNTILPKPFIKFLKANDSPTKSKTDKVKTAKKPPVKYAEQYRKPTKKPIDSSQNNIDDKGYWDSGYSRHMTGNISYLSDYEPFDGGYVSFESIMLGRDFKFLDDANVLLRTLMQHNMYSIDLNNIVPHRDLTCLVAKASADEGMLWHRRLGHLNFKTMNRLVRHNLVSGLPSKCFENDYTCTACLKRKQHKRLKGIKREFSNARTPQQNGVAERRNRDLMRLLKSDEVIKSSVENLIAIPSEFKGILDTMCDVHLVNNPTHVEAKDQFEIVINSNDDYSSSDDDSLYYENIEYVEASPHDYEFVGLEVEKIVIPKDEDIEDDNLCEKLLKVNLLISEIKALKDNPTLSSEFSTKSSSTSPKPFLISSGSTTTHSVISILMYEAFSFYDDHIKEIRSGSTTTQSDISLPKYDSFIFDLSNDQFPPSGRSDFTHEEFGDKLAHIISPQSMIVSNLGICPIRVKNKQEKDKIRTKPDKNGKRGEAGKSQKQLQSREQEKLKKWQVEGPKIQIPTKLLKKEERKGLKLQISQSIKNAIFSFGDAYGCPLNDPIILGLIQLICYVSLVLIPLSTYFMGVWFCLDLRIRSNRFKHDLPFKPRWGNDPGKLLATPDLLIRGEKQPVTRSVKINTAGASVTIVDRPVNTAGSKSIVNYPSLKSKAFKRGDSENTRTFNKFLANRSSIFNKKVNTVRVNDSTARERAVGRYLWLIFIFSPPVRKSTSLVESDIQTNTKMADDRTMAQMLQAPIEVYEDAIVVPPINANNFELKQTLINLVQSNQFTGRQDPHNHLRFFNKVTLTFRHPEVPNTTVKLLLFPFSLEGEDLLGQCPHHRFSELHQLDTFYNTLNPNDQDALDSAAGGNFLDRIPRECLSIIESKSKVRYSRSRVTDVRSNANANLSSSQSNSFDLQQIAASLKDKLSSLLLHLLKQLQKFVLHADQIIAIINVHSPEEGMIIRSFMITSSSFKPQQSNRPPQNPNFQALPQNVVTQGKFEA